MGAAKKRGAKSTGPTQAEHKQAIKVGPRIGEVSSAMYWYEGGHFDNEDEARGAFKLAYQQGLDGMGESEREWMGMTAAQSGAWRRSRALPSGRHGRASGSARAARTGTSRGRRRS